MLISIITINYNDKLGLENTIKSVIYQDFNKVEHIVIDGNSNDGSKAIIEQYKEHFGYWLSEADNGIYNAMNKGIKAAKGEYLLFLNSGDTLHADDVITNVAQILDHNVAIYYGDLMLTGEEKAQRLNFPKKLSFSYFYDKGYLPHPASFIKKTAFDTIGFYNEDFKIVSDWEFFIKAICKYQVSYKHMDLVVSNFDTNGISANPKYYGIKQQEKTIILENNFKHFLDDSKELVKYRALFKSNRFQLLNSLETNRFTQKVNSVWLRLLKFIFIKNK